MYIVMLYGTRKVLVDYGYRVEVVMYHDNSLISLFSFVSFFLISLFLLPFSLFIILARLGAYYYTD